MFKQEMKHLIDKLSKLDRTSNMHLEVGSHHYISLSLLYHWMQNVAVNYARGILLDYGCGGQPYRELVLPNITQYIGADLVKSDKVTLDLLLSVNTPLPLHNSSVDSIISTQVLEHVPDPGFYLSEASRVLKVGGSLILTAPMQWRHHEIPFDYYRYTKYGLHYLLEQNNFTIIKLDPCGGVFALIGQILANFLAENAIIYRKFYFRIINKIFLFLDKHFPDYDDSLLWLCIAAKKS
jgi:SAM-dependent methyltransferase